jgi:hypothetical protein
MHRRKQNAQKNPPKKSKHTEVNKIHRRKQDTQKKTKYTEGNKKYTEENEIH